MNLELIGQLVSVALIVGAGPIIVAAVYARGGNLKFITNCVQHE